MKKILIAIISFSLIYADSIDDIVKKIKSIRESHINQDKLKHLESPIVKIVEKKLENENNKTVIRKSVIGNFTLKAIMNHKAYINNKWYSKGDKIGSYTLVDIMDDAVYLKSKDKSKMIFFNHTNSKIIKTIGR